MCWSHGTAANGIERLYAFLSAPDCFFSLTVCLSGCSPTVAIRPSVCLSVCQSVCCLHVRLALHSSCVNLSVCLVCPSASLSVQLFFLCFSCLFPFPSVSICLSACLSVCLYMGWEPVWDAESRHRRLQNAPLRKQKKGLHIASMPFLLESS